jgi:hypothetical protein
MKKVLLSLLAVAALVLSCQNYDDEFDALNSKIASLESQITSLAELRTAVTGVQSSISALQTAVASAQAAAEAAGDAAEAAGDANAEAAAANAESIAALATSVAAIAADLVELQTAIAGATTEADLTALRIQLETTLAALQAIVEANQTQIAELVSSNADLKNSLKELGIDVDSVLAGSSTFNGNLVITTAAQLAFAKTLADRVAKIDGNVTITLSSGNGLLPADVNAVTSLIENVSGYVVINTNASFDLSNLKSVSGLYSVTGKDIDDSGLESTGDVNLNYDGGYSMPNLKTAGKILLTNYATTAAGVTPVVVGTLSIDLSGLTVGTSVTTAPTAHTSGGSHTSGGTLSLTGLNEGAVNAQDATSIKIGDAAVTSVTTEDATEVTLGFDGTLASLTIDDTGTTASTQKLAKVFVSATKVTGTLSADINHVAGELHLTNATQVGALTSDAAIHDLADLVYVGVGDGTKTTGSTALVVGNISLTATKSVSLPALKRVGDITIPGITELSLPEATEAGHVDVEAVVTFSAEKAVVSRLDIDEAGSLTTAGAVPATSVTVKSVTTLDDAGTIVNAVFKEQAATFDLTTLAKAKAIEYSGKSSSVNASISNLNAELLAIALDGKLGTVTINAAGKLTTVATSGTVYSFNLTNNTKVEDLLMDHTEDAALGALINIFNNDKLESFVTKVNRVLSFDVSGNAVLTSFDASSMTSLPANATSSTVYYIRVAGNAGDVTGTSGGRLSNRTGLQGTYTGVTATTAEAFSQASLLTLKPYAVLVANAATANTLTASAALGSSPTGTFIYMNYEYGPTSTTLRVAEIGTTAEGATTSAVKADLAALN